MNSYWVPHAGLENRCETTKSLQICTYAHTLDEVGNLGTILLTVYPRTFLAIFIEIGPYLTDKEQKISWHSFF